MTLEEVLIIGSLDGIYVYNGVVEKILECQLPTDMIFFNGSLFVANGKKIYYSDKIISRGSEIRAFAVSDGTLYDASGCIFETLTSKTVAKRGSTSIIDFEGKLYDASYNGEIRETLTDKLVVKRNRGHIKLFTDGKELYDFGVNGVYKTLSNELISKRNDLISMAKYDGNLYGITVEGEIYKLPEDKFISRRNGWANTITVCNGVLYDGGYYGLYETLSGKQVLDKEVFVLLPVKKNEYKTLK